MGSGTISVVSPLTIKLSAYIKNKKFKKLKYCKYRCWEAKSLVSDFLETYLFRLGWSCFDLKLLKRYFITDNISCSLSVFDNCKHTKSNVNTEGKMWDLKGWLRYFVDFLTVINGSFDHDMIYVDMKVALYMSCLVGFTRWVGFKHSFLCTFRNSTQINHHGNEGAKAISISLVGKWGI